MGGLKLPFMNPWMTQGNPMGFAGGGVGLKPQPSSKPVGWTPEQEASFRLWMNKQAATKGTSGNADSPMQAYNYRGLYRTGDGFTLDKSDNRLHGSSAFKEPNHPNRFVMHNGVLFDSLRGEHIDAAQLMGLLYDR